MALNGTAWAGYGNALAAYLEGDTPDELVPVAGGDAVPFVHDAASHAADATDAGLILRREMVVFVRAVRPEVGDLYTHGGRTWQVARAEYDRCAGADWPHQITLVAHAGQVAS